MSHPEAGSDALWGSTDDDDLILCDFTDSVMAQPTRGMSVKSGQSRRYDLTDSVMSQQPTRGMPAKSTQDRLQPKINQKNSTSWIASSFDGFDDFGQSSQTQKPKASTSRKRARNKSSEPMPPQPVLPAPAHSKYYRPRADELWADKYAPKTQADLAVHKKKIAEVEAWLQGTLQNSQGGPLCLLTGPAGAGKTATVQVLGREMGLELQEWSNPISAPASTWSDDFVPSRPDFVPVGGFQSVTQAGQFRDFLLRANRYPSLQLRAGPTTSRKVILVEEVPHIFSRDVTLFHDIIRQHCRAGMSPLIFIFSDISSGESAERTLFPKHLQSDLGIVNISFNPVATTSMVKVMQKVSSREALQNSHRFESPSKGTLEALSAASAGDIRGAINALQFVCLRGCTDMEAAVTQSQRADQLTGRASKSGARLKQTTRKKKTTKAAKKGGKVEDDREDHLAAIGGRDTSLFLFRALGKILYCKRGEPTNHPEHTHLPAHLLNHDRDPLLCHPEDVVERCHLSGDFFTAYLHQNYMEFFMEVDDVVLASKYLSDADYLTANWVGRSTLNDYAASVASRGLMFSNSIRARASAGATSGLGWKPLHKPALYDTMRKARENNASAKGLFKELSFICPPQELLTQVLPTLLMTQKSNLKPGQGGFLREVCRFTNQRFHIRSGERLDEKDVALQIPDDDDAITRRIGECNPDSLSKDIGQMDDADDELSIQDFDY